MLNGGKKIDVLIAFTCVRDFQPFSIVENAGFIDLIAYLDPKYPMISRKSLTYHLLPHIWETCLLRLREKLTNSIGGIAIAIDCWTSRANQSYMGITVHFINPDYTLEYAVLDTVPILIDEKAETLKEIIDAVLIEWGIRDRMVCLVSDNAANVIKTAKLLNMTHLPCYAHSLNLVIKAVFRLDDIRMPLTEEDNAVDTINAVISTSKNLVTYFHSSSKSTRFLNEMKKKCETPPEGLKQQVETRWNSVYYMLKSVLENIKFIKKVDCELELNLKILKKEDIKLANDICKILEPFEEVTRMISGSTYVTASLILPSTCALIKLLSEVVDAEPSPLETSFAKIFLRKVIRLIKERLVMVYEGRKVVKLCTVLDPRFKKKGFYYEQNYKEAVLLLNSTLAEKIKAKIHAAAEEVQVEKSKQPLKIKAKSMWDFLEEEDCNKIEKFTNNTILDAEIITRNYLERARISLNEDPLSYWCQSDLKNSELAKIMLFNLCVPGSSVPVERLFSSTGYIVTDRRNRISPQHLQMMAFLSVNFRYYNLL